MGSWIALRRHRSTGSWIVPAVTQENIWNIHGLRSRCYLCWPFFILFAGDFLDKSSGLRRHSAEPRNEPRCTRDADKFRDGRNVDEWSRFEGVVPRKQPDASQPWSLLPEGALQGNEERSSRPLSYDGGYCSSDRRGRDETSNRRVFCQKQCNTKPGNLSSAANVPQCSYLCAHFYFQWGIIALLAQFITSNVLPNE